MKFKVAKNIYSNAYDMKYFRKLLIKVALKRPANGLYVITPAIFNTGIMEIYNYNELLQPYYRKQKRSIDIIGIANSREDAKDVVKNILDDSYRIYGKPDIGQMFGLNC